jgi:hypothetical protein
MSDEKKAPAKKKARGPNTKVSVDLNDPKVAAEFDAVRAHMDQLLPGMNPTNQQVLRYALTSTAESLK